MIIALDLLAGPVRDSILQRVQERYDRVFVETYFDLGWVCCTRLDEASLMIVTHPQSPVPNANRFDIICPPGVKYPEAVVVDTFEEIETLLRLKR